MDYRKLLGVIFAILGIIFILYPQNSAIAVTWIAGIALIALGFGEIIDGFTLWSRITSTAGIKILLGILAILIGILFIYKIDALSFIVAFQFYIIAFILLFIGIMGLFVSPSAATKITSLLIIVIGIATIYLAALALAQPVYVAILVGIVFILEGLDLIIVGTVDNDLVA